ncbi:glutaredoxin [Anaerocolumna sedimenticola]|uniref:Glutaredoxin n=1 Tax=Anaerocolumna sedimenticola TaxID=2696063 RepID=A0A6P1TMZ4_9FIRM|nr:glutaredoxin family protein [Anaerocolumna sedimenticola]QHQ61559.1 glutaredoxin [Anaerocolumna sedimenticola]
MKVIMYGTEICPDCVEAKAELSTSADIQLDYRNITKNTVTLKEFLSYRDNDEIFTQIKNDGKIGIPFFILEDGTKTFDVYDFLEVEKPVKTANYCSIDGKGNC